jgi:hypothetical protein
MVCVRYVIVNTLHKGDNKDDDIIIIIIGLGPPPDLEGILLYFGLPRPCLCSDHNGKPILAEDLFHHCHMFLTIIFL